ncbi:MAG: cytochrome [Bradyrhizobium sp.]|nr:cytochrome [Bradyrhizobium sp.]
MHSPTDTIAPQPAHVPDSLVRDFDFYRVPGADDDVQLAWRSLHDTAPDIFWTPRNGGHWVATRHDDIKEIQTNHERFSHKYFTLPVDPASTFDPLPLSKDPPEHGPYRRIIMPTFMPKMVDRAEIIVRQVAVDLINDLAPKGECDFIEEFARKLPIAVFMTIVDLPFEDRLILLPHAEVVVRSGDMQKRREANEFMGQYLQKWVEARRENPGDDLISTVVHANVGDRPITSDEIFSLLILILFGGLDTVASMMGFICRFLATHPEHRHDLTEHPDLMRNAVEELIRRHGVSNTARYITQDFEYKGVQLRKADMIQIPNPLYGLDDRLVEDPLSVDFRRKRVQHAAFGNGPHTCPGAVLARREISVFLEEWLKRIPDFEIKPGTRAEVATGLVNGVNRLDIVWDPASTRVIL